MRWFSKIIFNKFLGWKIRGILPPLNQYVIIVVPHTSWHDFYIGALVRKILNQDINFVAKKELFKSPFGWYFKWMGGAPIDRSGSKGYVETICEIFKERKVFRLTIAPEGTRKKVEKWKSGFYFIALNAHVPIVSIAFNYKLKEVKISEPFYPTGNYEQDLREIKLFYQGVVGKKPEYT